MALTIGGPVLGTVIICFAIWMVWKRVDRNAWRGHPVQQPVARRAVVLIAEPKSVKIPVVIVQPDKALDVGYPFAPRHARSASTGSLSSEGSLDYRVLTVVDTAQCGPLWSAPVAALSDCSDSDTPRSRRPGCSSFGSPAELAMLQEQAQAQLLAQAPASPEEPRAGSSRAAGGKAAARHARCRSLDVGPLSYRLDKERPLVAWQLQQQANGEHFPAASAAGASASGSAWRLSNDTSPPTPPQLAARPQHRRSRSATVAPLCR
ncbi:hypothetical protein COHA_003780 [Chlorella ohadii]|uniref:Uncharacterized protein n=1 Tax=Chlorella ohadii TaxID=2649997 RepID=A0AAD5DU51_9CHLO|nr:hypothetical protein COHA_003780 [Chlorella ohadii]